MRPANIYQIHVASRIVRLIGTERNACTLIEPQERLLEVHEIPVNETVPAMASHFQPAHWEEDVRASYTMDTNFCLSYGLQESNLQISMSMLRGKL